MSTSAEPTTLERPHVAIEGVPPPSTPAEALQALKDGNARFVGKATAAHDAHDAIERTAGGQAPFAAVLSCIDSRVPVETVFDLTIGHLFSARVAGNVVSGDVLGSLEYACAFAGTPLVVIMGHTSCGAVSGACDGVNQGHLDGLLGKIQPSVEAIDTDGERSSDNLDWVNEVSQENVERQKKALLDESDVLRDLVNKGEVALVGAMYDVNTGEVAFYDEVEG